MQVMNVWTSAIGPTAVSSSGKHNIQTSSSITDKGFLVQFNHE